MGLTARALRPTGGRPLGMDGIRDFNAPHTTRGYNKNTPKGNKLLAIIKRQHLSLLNDPNSPTRHGNSVERDTTPDLTLLKRPTKATWTKTHDTLTSDHTLIKINLYAENYERSKRPH
ncbi:hypothetical protein HPB47_017987 [Ixodes persulcatus]|uniref:Uncharacterized protein n=1 Tax=Ixodes persulcatus TaxID=34615 RepID=A0AC60QNV3_IXOPE|nr:hypothetical protein HPB47_017987 [Ixodes persulcatus]